MAVSTSSIYTKGSLVDSDKDWYHGELTRVLAEKPPRDPNQDPNCFFIRESRARAKRTIVMTLIYHGMPYHITILEYGPGQYRLKSVTSC